MSIGFDGAEKNIHEDAGDFRPFGVLFEQVEIIQGKTARFLDDKKPIAVRVAKFFQERVQTFGQAEIAGHDLLQGGIFGVDGHIDMVAGNICIQGLRLNLHTGSFPQGHPDGWMFLKN